MSEHDTDASVIVDTAIAAAKTEEVDVETVHHVIVPEGAKSLVFGLERFRPQPLRKQGAVTLHTGASLAAYVNEHKELGGTRLYADVYSRTIVGVLNGHAVASPDAGWGDHSARMQLRHTPEWEAWAALNGKLVGQVEFAEHVEDRLDDIVEPAGADLLELAKTFEAKTNISFRQATVLESGERQLEYVENIDARAGTQGKMTIPKEFVLGIAPFEGTQPYKVVARLRYRIGEGRLAIGYQLVKAEDVQRAAFDDTLTEVEAATELTAFRGLPLVLPSAPLPTLV